MVRLILAAASLALVVGCNYRLTPKSRICDDIGFAISERTAVCTEDLELANARFEAYEAASACLMPDEVEDPYNPNDILPVDAEDRPEEAAQLDRAYDCVRAIRALDCEQVLAEGESIAWWLSQYSTCAEFVDTPGIIPPTDTGLP